MLSRALLIVVGTHAALVSPPTHAQSFGDWTVGAGQGWIEYRVENGPGNSFMIACDEAYSGGQKETHISVSIRDKSPPAESSAKLFVDGKEFWMGVDAKQELSTDCRACDANFDAIWQNLRTGRTLLVLLADGRTSSFSLKGAGRALPKKPCKTAFAS